MHPRRRDGCCCSASRQDCHELRPTHVARATGATCASVLGTAGRIAIDMDMPTALDGLTDVEAAAQLVTDGPNELPSTSTRGLIHLILDVLREPMLLMLIVAGMLYVLVGEAVDAAMLLASVFVIIGITVVQERRTEEALHALRDLSTPTARVWRQGRIVRVPSREVVVGDIVLVGEGDRVPADATLLRATNLSMDESLLTGESVPVLKDSLGAPAGAAANGSLLAGTLVASGHGTARVTATGPHSTLGKIGNELASIGAEPTSMQRETAQVVRFFAIIGVGACILVALWYAVTRGRDLVALREGVLAGVAMAMGILPEEFPVVVTVFLALGAWRISQSNVLTRRMPAIEALGSTTVLCVDKTGTLTCNRMTTRWLIAGSDAVDLATAHRELPEATHVLLEHAVLASRPDGFDPMDRALRDAADAVLGGTEHQHPEWSLVREYPMAPDRLAVVHAWVPRSDSRFFRRNGAGGLPISSAKVDPPRSHLNGGRAENGTFQGERGLGAVVVAKGAVEAVVGLCHLPKAAAEAIGARAAALASTGVRVLGVAVSPVTTEPDAMPDDPHDLGYEFLGLIGFEDPIRQTVPTAVAECQAAGVRVVMITGDNPETARSIAAQAGIADSEHVLLGTELATLPDEALAAKIATHAVYARVAPEQKLRIVRALQARGEVVAMTGDGVNDAPALRAAQIGIAMGGRGTDVARAAADLVLMDDDFSSMVAAMRLGRRIYGNIRKAIGFILAVHVPIIGLSMIPVLEGSWPLLLLPIHIVFLELVIDPTCTLVFEAELEDTDCMASPPRDPSASLFAGPMMLVALMQGMAILGACMWTFWQARDAGSSDGSTRALVFTCLVTGFLTVILTNRSWSIPLHRSLARPNSAFTWVMGGAITMLAMAVGTGWGQRLLHFDPPDPFAVGSAIGWPVAAALAFEAGKQWAPIRRRLSPGSRLSQFEGAGTESQTTLRNH